MAKLPGVIGAGKIGKAFINIMNGFGARVIAYDKYPDPEINKIKTDTGRAWKIGVPSKRSLLG